jgi:hypothetical protein
MNARGAPWWDPVLDQKDPSIIYIYAGQGGGTASWGSYDRCTPVARLVAQTESAVTISVARPVLDELTAEPRYRANLCCSFTTNRWWSLR